MDIKQLKAKGGMVSPGLVKKEVEWEHDENGETVTDKFTVFVKKSAFGVLERIYTGNDDSSKSAALICNCIRLGDEGKEELTYDEAYQLEPSLGTIFLRAINEVNGRDKPKN